MQISIDKQAAERILLEAYRERCSRNDLITDKISKILNGTHKTYRYVLITGILAKATNEGANPLALQAGADLDGAYDARSLCHQVIVPFERDFLKKVLGDSNEPFLNKPARFPVLSKDNAVRSGNDYDTLMDCIFVLSEMKSSLIAKSYLACCLSILNERITRAEEANSVYVKFNPSLAEIFEFIVHFVQQSHEGETCVLVTTVLEKMLYRTKDKDIKIHPHKSNQSGASSKEVGDIDIYGKEQYLYSIEVKDKNFNVHDFKHAIDKVKTAGGSRAQFIYGQNAGFNGDEIDEAIREYQKKGFIVLFNNILTYSRLILVKAEIEDKKEFINALFETADEINVKDATRSWIREVLVKLGWT